MDRDKYKEDILARLRTIKGHITGIERMIEEKKDCEDILLQIMAVKSSIDKIGSIMAEEHALQCLLNSEDGKIDKEKAERVIKTLIKYMK